MNLRPLEMFPGEERSDKSVDTISSQDQVVNYSAEFLYSLEPTGTASHNLLLKLGAPITQLHNLYPPKFCKAQNLLSKICSLMISQKNFLERTASSPKYL